MKIQTERKGKPYSESRTILAIAVLIVVIGGAPSLVLADGGAALMNQVNAALRSNDRLNGAKAYTAAEGVVVLYGTVLDDKDRALAEQTANAVPGVSSVIDNLQTQPANGSKKRSVSSSSSR